MSVSEWVTATTTNPKSKDMGREPWTSPNLKEFCPILMSNFHCDLQTCICVRHECICSAWTKWTFFPRRKYNNIIDTPTHRRRTIKDEWKVDHKKNQVFCWVSVIFNFFSIFICCIIGYYLKRDLAIKWQHVFRTYLHNNNNNNNYFFNYFQIENWVQMWPKKNVPKTNLKIWQFWLEKIGILS